MPIVTKPKDIQEQNSSSLLHGVKERAKNLSPAYFGMVMATGIVSIAAHLSGFSLVAVALFWLNIGIYLLLWLLNTLRAIWFTGDFFRDMVDHQRGMGFFTFVAGSCVLGSQFVLIAGNYKAAQLLLALGLFLWIGVTYTIFTGFTIKEDKPPLETGISGAWLLAVVATQSLAVLSALIAPHWGQPYKVGTELLSAVHVAGGWHALHLDDFPHFLPLHILQVFTRRPGATLLDQHGSYGHFHTGWFSADYQLA